MTAVASYYEGLHVDSNALSGLPTLALLVAVDRRPFVHVQTHVTDNMLFLTYLQLAVI